MVIVYWLEAEALTILDLKITKDQGKKKDNFETADAGVVEDNSDGADVLSVTISSLDGGWILGMSYSYHMCPNRDWFSPYRSFDGCKVLMGNNVACKVVGICSIQIRIHDGIVRTLTDVRRVPELRKKLISLGILDSNGCSYQASGGVMMIMKGALVVMKGLKQNSLYLLHGSTVTGVATTTLFSGIDSDTTKLWHMGLGHMSERGMDVEGKQGSSLHRSYSNLGHKSGWPYSTLNCGSYEDLENPSAAKKKIGFATFATGIVHGLQPDALMMVLPTLALPSRLTGAAFLVYSLYGKAPEIPSILITAYSYCIPPISIRALQTDQALVSSGEGNHEADTDEQDLL
ncbi:hypothetical protein RJ640_007371 [Escallonia rubra]|uniref:Retrovirus-related Pol polyprotein from transposon TNT 1-94-like beta-barrel domain-containing protein n=1 Tax=Escallonia rubra TaxID=112253 RepID=A0AA88UQD5_9ASTE|nr:hypothetical protein RJ640_007371 [Escallonia rubra]